jgi:hypothetical protein
MRAPANSMLRAARLPLVGMLLALSVCAAGPARGYDPAGHFYTISLVVSMIKPPLAPAAAKVVSFCAELPDHSSDLDAASVYQRSITRSWNSPRSWVRWARNDEVGSDALKRMVTVQQLLHGLTGGSAAAVQYLAANTVRKLRQQMPATNAAAGFATWCAVGLGLHLFGDAFAHTMMGPGGTDTDDMYSTGLGHAKHYHYPDWPLCGELLPKPVFGNNCKAGQRIRYDRWGAHWSQALGLLATGLVVDWQLFDAIIADVFALAASAADANDWEEARMRSVLVTKGADKSIGEFLDKHKSSAPCQDVLDRALAGNGPLAGIPRFTCRVAWSLFYKAVLPEFDGNRNAFESPASNLEATYVPDPLIK